MTGPEHYREAEKILDILNEERDPEEWALSVKDGDVAVAMAAAQVHATLALAAATALANHQAIGLMPEADSAAWYRAASGQPAENRRMKEARAAEVAEFAADPDFGPEAYKNHQPGCECWDCKAAREGAQS